VWQVRHGGRLFTAYPYLLAAEQGLDEVLPLMPKLVEHTHALGVALGELDDVSIVPAPPQAAMFRVHLRRDAERLVTAALDLAEETRTWVGWGWQAGPDPTIAAMEVSIGEANLRVTPREAAELYAELLGRAA
jgi:hypothetical protein